MMAVSQKPTSITLPTTNQPSSQAQPCPCGCAPCPDECCDLECLVRPRYFCGQLLTDQDLTAHVHWNQAQHRLARYRDGWGVVHGLPVTCDSKHPYRVVVGPGYAVSCCGDDIVVCEPDALDLRDACRPDVDPCADLDRLRNARAKISSEYDWADEAENRLLDIYIGYAESHSAPVPVMGGNGCGERDDCEYTRTHEGHRLFYRFAHSASNPLDDAAQVWDTALDSCREVLTRFRKDFPADTLKRYDGEAIQRWFLRWIKQHPMLQSCYVYENLCAIDNPALFTRKELVGRLLLMLLLDCRNHFLTYHRPPCPDQHGVPLARVAVQVRDSNGNRQCQVVAIDPYPPYRRLLATDDWPAPLGMINAGCVIWHPVAAARRTLADLGVPEVKVVTFDTLANLKNATWPDILALLTRWLDQSLFIGYDAQGSLPPVTLWTVEDPGLDVLAETVMLRVIGVSQEMPADRNAVTKDDWLNRGSGRWYTRAPQTSEDNPAPVKDRPATERDDLSDIDGIGNTRRDLLYAQGIRTFEDMQTVEALEAVIANMSTAELRQFGPVGEDRLKKWAAAARERVAERQRDRGSV